MFSSRSFSINFDLRFLHHSYLCLSVYICGSTISQNYD